MKELAYFTKWWISHIFVLEGALLQHLNEENGSNMSFCAKGKCMCCQTNQELLMCFQEHFHGDEFTCKCGLEVQLKLQIKYGTGPCSEVM